MAKQGGQDQTEERLDAALLAKEGPLPAGRLLLEETQRRQNDERGSHEAQGPGHRVYLRLLRAFGHPANVPPALLLATAKS